MIVQRKATTAEAVALFPPSQLLDAGFVRIGWWTSISDAAFALDSIAPREPGVYAFVVDGVIRYVGLTQRGLRGRMAHYVRGHSRQRTSARVKELILAALRAGSSIEILVAMPAAMEWNGLPVLTAPGLEAGLIRSIRPEWNMQGIGR
jgi:excinuclease UvrABC nuclease subunit